MRKIGADFATSLVHKSTRAGRHGEFNGNSKTRMKGKSPLIRGSRGKIMINNLKYWREKRGYTQADIASFCGISRNTVSSIERGQFLPTLKVAMILARSLYVPVTALFDFSDDMKIYNEPLTFHDSFEDVLFDIGDYCPFGGTCHRSHCEGCAIFEDNLEDIAGMDPFFE